MIDKNFMSLDLELNKENGQCTDIIQVGVIIGNLKTGQILYEYNNYIKIKKEIDPFITKLTGIKQEDVNNGIYLEECYEDLIELHKIFDCFRNPLVWGGGDTLELKKQLNIYNDEIFLFGRRWIDVKTLFISYQWSKDLHAQAGLSKAMNKLGLQFNGKKHNACSDALNTFLIYRELLNKFERNN